MHDKEAEEKLTARLVRASRQVAVGARYAHYKHKQRSYIVVALALGEADHEPCVVYRAEYDDKLTWIRPLKNWLELIDVDGQKVPRFTKL